MLLSHEDLFNHLHSFLFCLFVHVVVLVDVLLFLSFVVLLLPLMLTMIIVLFLLLFLLLLLLLLLLLPLLLFFIAIVAAAAAFTSELKRLVFPSDFQWGKTLANKPDNFRYFCGRMQFTKRPFSKSAATSRHSVRVASDKPERKKERKNEKGNDSQSAFGCRY